MQDLPLLQPADACVGANEGPPRWSPNHVLRLGHDMQQLESSRRMQSNGCALHERWQGCQYDQSRYLRVDKYLSDDVFLGPGAEASCIKY